MTRPHARLRSSVLALVVGGAAGCTGPPSAGPASVFAARLDSLIPALMAEHAVPGFAVGVVEDGRVAFTREYGVADRASGAPVNPETLFNVASVSKAVTTWGVLHLAETGAISLDAPADRYLRRWHVPASDFAAEGVTVRRLLSHTAGTSVPSAPWFPADGPLPTLVEVLNGEAGEGGPVVVERAPGERWSYSGGGYMVLQLLIEDVTGKSFESYMRSAVFDPLGMRAATYYPPLVTGPGVALPYNEDGEPVSPYRLVGEAAGGLYATPADLVRFLLAYTDAGAGVIGEELFTALAAPVAPVVLEGVEGATYGLGHGVHRTLSGEAILYHSGGNPGHLAYFLVAPGRGDGIVLLANSANAVPVIVQILHLWGDHYGLDLQPIY